MMEKERNIASSSVEVVSKKENDENDEEERKHFCKVIGAFRFYRFVQLTAIKWYLAIGNVWWSVGVTTVLRHYPRLAPGKG